LIIEVDGSHHAESASDQKRDAELVALGYRVVRIWNNDISDNLDSVLEMLLFELRR
jgi:very-short-patch-repair endonuclease